MAISWIFPALIAVAMWGVSSFISKLAVKKLSPLPLTICTQSFFLLWTLLLQGAYRFEIGFDPRGAALGFAVGVLGASAQVLYTTSLTKTSLTKSVAVTSLYPVVATFMAFALLGETLHLRQALGMALGVASLILMVTAHDEA